MSDAGYVAAGWLLTAAAVAAYWARVVTGARRARRTLPGAAPSGRPGPGAGVGP